MNYSSARQTNRYLKNFSLGKISISIDEFLNNAIKWGISDQAVRIITAVVHHIRNKDPLDERLNNICLNDHSVYRLLQSGDTEGVINLESSGMRGLLCSMQPGCFEDIMALCAIYRPGPLNAGTTDTLMASKQGTLPITSIHPKMESILKDTYGVIVYLEQLTELAEKFANFDYSDSRKLLQVLRENKADKIVEVQLLFIRGCKRHSITESAAHAIFAQMESASAHCFSKQLATGYALTAYLCAFLKAHYPEEFKTAMDTLKIGCVGK
jgi:DNA polymerase-3 subunit alpha